MKAIKKMMRYTIFEIIMVLILATASLPLWDSLDINGYTSLAAYYNNYDYIDVVVDNDDNYNLEYVDSVFCRPIFVDIYNNSNTLDDYQLWIKLDKKYSRKSDEFVVKIGKEHYNLSTLATKEDSKNVYYLLMSGELVANSVESVIYLGTASESSELIGKNIEFDIKNITRQSI